MRTIVLNTAATDNDGVRHEAGDQLKVGTGKSEIRSERVEQLLARNLCSEVAKTEGKGESKAAAGSVVSE